MSDRRSTLGLFGGASGCETPVLPALEYELFRRLIRDRFGLDYPPQKRELLRVRLERRTRALGIGYGDYYRMLRYSGDGCAEWRKLADAITNNETYFFREKHHFVQLAEILSATGAEPRRLRALSAGCSSGEEAYSIAMVAASSRVPPLDLVGIDVSAAKLAEASEGRYSHRSFREDEGPPGHIDVTRFLSRSGDGSWSVHPALRLAVAFERRNLVERADLAALDRFDIVFCRNVLIYAHEESLPRFLEGLEALVRPNGYLFLGHSEALLTRRSAFRHVRVAGAFVLRREPE